MELFLTVVVLMSTFKNMNSLKTIEAQIVQKLKNNEAQPKFTGSYKKKRVACFLYQPYKERMRQLSRSRVVLCSEEIRKRDSKNLLLSYYIFGVVNNSQLDAKSIGKSLVGAKPIWQREKP